MSRTTITPMLSDLKYQKLAAQTEREVFMNSVLKGTYVKMEDVQATWDTTMTSIKNFILGMPAAVVPLLGVEDKDKAIRIMRNFVYDYLNDAEKLEEEIIRLRNRKMTKYKAKLDENDKSRINMTRVKV